MKIPKESRKYYAARLVPSQIEYANKVDVSRCRALGDVIAEMARYEDYRRHAEQPETRFVPQSEPEPYRLPRFRSVIRGVLGLFAL